jgi:hypothetical protein
MTDLRTAAQQALEALEFMADEWGFTQKANSPERWQAIDALRAALEQPEQPNECHWYQDGDEDSDKWAASCGRHRYFQLNDGTPTDNRMTHCCYCGKPLVEVPIDPEDNHD